MSSWSNEIDTAEPSFDWNESISALTGDGVAAECAEQPIPVVPITAEVPEKRIPRPPNAWILYRSDCISKMRANMPEGAPKPTQANLSKQFGEKWRNESPDVKAHWDRLAEIARDEHAAKYPGKSTYS